MKELEDSYTNWLLSQYPISFVPFESEESLRNREKIYEDNFNPYRVTLDNSSIAWWLYENEKEKLIEESHNGIGKDC